VRGLLETLDVAGMQEIEAAVGENDAAHCVSRGQTAESLLPCSECQDAKGLPADGRHISANLTELLFYHAQENACLGSRSLHETKKVLFALADCRCWDWGSFFLNLEPYRSLQAIPARQAAG